MTKLYDLTLNEALIGLKNRDFSSAELTNAFLSRMEKFRTMNAYITETPERALADATAADKRIADGNTLPLDGAPIGMKDLFATRGIRTTAASRILENFVPDYESTISKKLTDAGTVLLGKLNLDEFACGTTSKSSFFGTPINPWKNELKLIAGGSSGGSTVAVAGGLCLAATGTDTGGSIRYPSSITGLVGFKPTYGTCSRYGCIAYSSSLDTPGTLSRTVMDAALMFDTMRGYDPMDATSSPEKFDPATPEIGKKSVSKLRVGTIREINELPLSDDARKLYMKHLESLKSMGAEIIEFSMPLVHYALHSYAIITATEVASNLARYDGVRYGLRVDGTDLNDMYVKTRNAGFGGTITRKIMLGATFSSSKYFESHYVQAARVRQMVTDAFDDILSKCDLLLTPTCLNPAFPIDREMNAIDASALDLLVLPMNLAGLPSCSVPSGLTTDGLPVGIQVVGRRFDDNNVLAFAHVVEQLARDNGFDNKPSLILGE